MKPWQLNKKNEDLSRKLDDSINTQTRIDFNCLSEREMRLFERVLGTLLRCQRLLRVWRCMF